MLKTTLFFLAALLGLGALSTESKAQTYSFDVPEKLVNISFESRMDVEDIIGSTNKAKGAVTRQKDGRLTFRVQVPVASLRTGIAVRDEHLRSESWLDAKRHPHIQLKGDKARKLSGDTWRLTGTFTMRGVSRPLQVDVTVKQIPAAVARKAGLEAANDSHHHLPRPLDTDGHPALGPHPQPAKAPRQGVGPDVKLGIGQNPPVHLHGRRLRRPPRLLLEEFVGASPVRPLRGGGVPPGQNVVRLRVIHERKFG